MRRLYWQRNPHFTIVPSSDKMAQNVLERYLELKKFPCGVGVVGWSVGGHAGGAVGGHHWGHEAGGLQRRHVLDVRHVALLLLRHPTEIISVSDPYTFYLDPDPRIRKMKSGSGSRFDLFAFFLSNTLSFLGAGYLIIARGGGLKSFIGNIPIPVLFLQVPVPYIVYGTVHRGHPVPVLFLHTQFDPELPEPGQRLH